MFGQNIFDDLLGWPFQLELILRILLSFLAGAIIGYERKKREKVAGMRTHIIAAVASTTFSICSKYSYFDVLSYNGMSVDAARVAANVVTGICFLGTGMIFVKNRSIKGLTTAAGVWAVSGIGMCFGNGLYIIGAAVTLIMIVVQFTMHNSLDTIEGRQALECTIMIRNGDENMDPFVESLKKQDPKLMILGVTRENDGCFSIRLSLHSGNLDIDNDVWSFMKRYDYVISCNL